MNRRCRGDRIFYTADANGQEETSGQRPEEPWQHQLGRGEDEKGERAAIKFLRTGLTRRSLRRGSSQVTSKEGRGVMCAGKERGGHHRILQGWFARPRSRLFVLGDRTFTKRSLWRGSSQVTSKEGRGVMCAGKEGGGHHRIRQGWFARPRSRLFVSRPPCPTKGGAGTGRPATVGRVGGAHARRGSSSTSTVSLHNWLTCLLACSRGLGGSLVRFGPHPHRKTPANGAAGFAFVKPRLPQPFTSA